MGVSVYPCPSDNGESDYYFPDHNPCFYKNRTKYDLILEQIMIIMIWLVKKHGDESKFFS